MDGAPLAIGKALAKGRKQLLLFVSPHCPLCKDLIPIAKNFARAEKLDIVFVGDDEASRAARHDRAAGDGRPAFRQLLHRRPRLHVDRLPHAVLIGEEGRLLSKGLVNSREHLESLVTAHEMGVVSVQDYLPNQIPKTKVA